MARDWRASRYGLLLAVIVSVLLVGSPLAEAGYPLLATAFGAAAVIASGVIAVGDDPRTRILTFGVAALALVLQVAAAVAAAPRLVLAERGLFVAFLGLMIAAILGRIVRESHVRSDTILGGVSVYLLLGLVFAAVFEMLEVVAPGSFLKAGRPLEPHTVGGRTPELLYFSFVALTTLGFGDITPTRSLPKLLSTFEAVVGQLYLAILIASLVGIRLAERQTGRQR